MIYKFIDDEFSTLEICETNSGRLMISANDNSQPETILFFDKEDLHDIIGCLLNIQKKLKDA